MGRSNHHHTAAITQARAALRRLELTRRKLRFAAGSHRKPGAAEVATCDQSVAPQLRRA